MLGVQGMDTKTAAEASVGNLPYLFTKTATKTIKAKVTNITTPCDCQDSSSCT